MDLRIRKKSCENFTKSNLIYLDYSDLLVFTREELEKALNRLPEFKCKSNVFEQHELLESTRQDEERKSKNHQKNCSTEAGLQYLSVPYADPKPVIMSQLNLNDFCDTKIDWKMLTLLRPSSKLEEDYFSRLIELYQLRHKTKLEDGYGFRKAVFKVTRHPRVLQYKPVHLATDSFGFGCDDSRKSFKEDIDYEAYSRVPFEGNASKEHFEDIEEAEELLWGNTIDAIITNKD